MSEVLSKTSVAIVRAQQPSLADDGRMITTETYLRSPQGGRQGITPAPVDRSRPGRFAWMSTPSLKYTVGAVGNVLEWYDFAVYGYFAAIFGKNFFPSSDPVVSLAAAFGAFAAAFVMRPVGGALFGHVGDRHGRKQALLLSSLLMTIATVAIAFLPTYSAVGALAPILLIGLRLLQGLSIGGEFATSIVFLVEQSRPNRRGFLGSFASIGATSGILLGSGVGALTSACFSAAELTAWGWRVPFLFGLLLGGAILLLRCLLKDDAPRNEEARGLPLKEALLHDWRDILRGGAIAACFAGGFYLVFIYVVTLMHQIDGLSQQRALEINTFSMAILLAATPLFGALSDRIGRKRLLLTTAGGIALLAVPLFWLMLQHNLVAILIGQGLFGLLIAAWAGSIEATLVELYRGRTRCTSLGISYNLAMAVFGGTAPMVAVYLVSREHAHLGPAIYLAVLAVASFAALLTMRDRTGQPLG